MNAVPPKGQMPARGARPQAEAEEDHIHLTMSFEEDEASPAGAQPPLEDDSAMAESGAATQRRARPSAEAGPSPSPEPARSAILPQFAAIELSLTVEVGSLNIPLKDLVSVEPGQLLALDRMTNEPVTVLVNGKPFARGEIVAVGERYGVRLLEIVAPAGGAG